MHDVSTAGRVDSPVQAVLHEQGIELVKVLNSLFTAFGQNSGTGQNGDKIDKERQELGKQVSHR